MKLQLQHAQTGQLKPGHLPAGYSVPRKLSTSGSGLQAGTDTDSGSESHGTPITQISKSSTSETYFVDGPPVENAKPLDKDIFVPQSRPERKLVTAHPPLAPVRPANARKESDGTDEVSVSNSGPSSSATPAVDLPQEEVLATAPNEAIIPETKATATTQEKVLAKTIARGQRNIKIQKWVATFALISIK
jgi:hypothetical protein